MTTLADITTATLDPHTGDEVLQVRHHGYKLLGTATLYDLLDRGRLGRTGEGRGSKVVLLDPSPVPEPSLEHALSKVRKHPTQSPGNAILRMGGGIKLREGLHDGLAAEGVLGPRERSGLFGSRYRVLDPRRRDALVGRLHAMLLGGRPADEATRRVACLLTVGDVEGTGRLLDIVLDWPGMGPPPTGRDRDGARRHAIEVGMAAVREDWVALTALRAITLPKRLSRLGVAYGIAEVMIPD